MYNAFDFYRKYVKTAPRLQELFLISSINDAINERTIKDKLTKAAIYTAIYIVVGSYVFDLIDSVSSRQWGYACRSFIPGGVGLLGILKMGADHKESMRIREELEKHKATLMFFLEKTDTDDSNIQKLKVLLESLPEDKTCFFQGWQGVDDKQVSVLENIITSKRDSVNFKALQIILEAIMFKAIPVNDHIFGKFVGRKTNSFTASTRFAWVFNNQAIRKNIRKNIRESTKKREHDYSNGSINDFGLLETKGILLESNGKFKEARDFFRKEYEYIYSMYNEKRCSDEGCSGDERTIFISTLYRLREKIESNFRKENASISKFRYILFGYPHSENKIEEEKNRLFKIENRLNKKFNTQNEEKKRV